MKQSKLDVAIEMLTNKYQVVPEKYTMYNGAFLFEAYPRGMKDKTQCMNVHYLVDLKHKKVGPFSAAFDFEGFFKAVENMTRL
jgi:hypothetical protein